MQKHVWVISVPRSQKLELLISGSNMFPSCRIMCHLFPEVTVPSAQKLGLFIFWINMFHSCRQQKFMRYLILEATHPPMRKYVLFSFGACYTRIHVQKRVLFCSGSSSFHACRKACYLGLDATCYIHAETRFFPQDPVESYHNISGDDWSAKKFLRTHVQTCGHHFQTRDLTTRFEHVTSRLHVTARNRSRTDFRLYSK